MRDAPRIGVVTPYAPSRLRGGVETFNDYLARALGNVTVFADAAPPGSSRHLARFGLGQPYRALRSARAFLRAHGERPFDLVISNGMCGWPLAFADLDIPMLQVYHFTMAGLARQALTLPGDRWSTGHVAAFFDGLAGHRKAVVAVSDPVLAEVERFYGHSGRVIPNAVDTERFRPIDRNAARELLGLPPDATVGLFVGRAEPAKGVDVLRAVARSMPDVLFAVAGGDGLREPNVRAFPGVPHERMPDLYGAADFFFLPSRYEGFNLSILEALACDVPIVVSAAAYPFSEDPAAYGAVVRGADPSRYVAAIRTVLARRGALAPRGSVVGRYSLDVFAANWRAAVASLLDGDAATPGCHNRTTLVTAS